MPLTGEVRRSPEPSARPSAAADSEERQICTTCLFAESVGLCLCFLPSCAMYKDNAVRNVVAEMGRDLVFMITARLSDLSMPLKGEVRRSPVQSARQPIARSGKFVRRAYSRRALDCEKDDGLISAIDLAGNSLLQQLLTAPAGLCQNDVSAWVAPAIVRFATDSRNQPFL